MRTRKQTGQVIRIGDRWYVRYWERRNVGGSIERKRVAHPLGPVTARGKRAPSEIMVEAEKHMHTVNNGSFAPERIVTISDFVKGVYFALGRTAQTPFDAEGLSGHLAGSPKGTLREAVAERHSHVPRSMLVKRDRQQ